MYKLLFINKLNTKELLDYVLNKYNIKKDIIYNSYGKPYLKNNELYFNLSNSGIYSICGISDKEIGVDIERITYKERVIERICNDLEKEFIKDKDDFTMIWVKKEAYVKYLGKGLSYGLKNVDTTKLDIILKKYNDYYIGIYLK